VESTSVLEKFDAVLSLRTPSKPTAKSAESDLQNRLNASDDVLRVSSQSEAPPLPADGKGTEAVLDTTDVKQTEALVQREIARPDAVTSIRELANHTVKSVRYLANQQGEQTMKVRLVPESLGELRLEVTSSGTTITVRMASANPAVREVLQGNLQGLRDALSQDGYHAADVTVTADASSGQGQSEWLYRDTHDYSEALKTQTRSLGFVSNAPNETESVRSSVRLSPHLGRFSVSV